MNGLPEITDQCEGKWTQILGHIGVDAKYLTGKHSECVCCQSGKDTFRWDKVKEIMFCGYCGNKGGMQFAMAYLNMNFKETAAYIRENILGVVKMDVPRSQPTDYEKNRARLDKIKAGCVKITAGDPVDLYLKKRGISILPEMNVSYNPGVDYWEKQTVADEQGNNIEKWVLIGTYPAMIAGIRSNEIERVTDKGVEIYKRVTYKITYLTPDGKKANVQSPKKLMPTEREMNGACVRMFRFTDTLALAEGIETALAFTQDSGLPCWSCDTAGNMEKFNAPDGVKNVIIIADNDKNYQGYKSAFILANRLSGKGINVNVGIFVKYCGELEFTMIGGGKFDYLDYLNNNQEQK